MPTQITPRARGIDSRDVAPLSLTALAVVAILALVLHVAGTEVVNRAHANPDAAAPGGGAKCLAGVKPLEQALPYD